MRLLLTGGIAVMAYWAIRDLGLTATEVGKDIEEENLEWGSGHAKQLITKAIYLKNVPETVLIDRFFPYLRQCITYIDMNMVRAGVVDHAEQWEFCGYNEIRNPGKRKGIIDFDRLMNLLGFDNYDALKDADCKWVESAIHSETDSSAKGTKWTQSIAVGSKTFIEKIKKTLGYRGIGRKLIPDKDTFELREGLTLYGEADSLYSENTFLWD